MTIIAARSDPPIGWRALIRSKDASLAIAVLITVGMLVIPLPALILDILIALNVALSVSIILIAMYIREPMDFSVFPSVLLLVTLFRLGLSVATSRSILLNAAAGKVVATFGAFVVGGNYVVGVVIFLTLLIIQFVVITNGAGRVAEVAARFTLDAMPGKQLSIDADLNAGLVTESEARLRRRLVEIEADFYGAMDGASKFVRGDAIAAIAIVLINILGGFAVGVWQLHLNLLDALQTYTLLTVGAGLVVQIPALLISTAAGLIVTRAASEESLGVDVIGQLGNPNALGVTSALIIVLAFVPGLPTIPFLSVGAVMGGATYAIWQHQQTLTTPPGPPAQAALLPSPDDVSDLLTVDALGLEIGYGLIPLVGEEKAENLLRRITGIRRHLASELGLVLPKVRIRDNLQLSPYAYRIKVRGEDVSGGEVKLDRILAIGAADDDAPIAGEPTTEPTFGLPALWITEAERGRAEMAGFTVVDPISVITTHFTEVVRSHANELLGLQQVQELLDRVGNDAPAAVEGLVPNQLSLGEVQNVLRILLRERIPIRDLPVILEVLANNARATHDPVVLSEAVRQHLARTITNLYRHDDGRLHVFTLAPTLEAHLRDALAPTEEGLGLNVGASLAQEILRKTGEQMEALASNGYQPVLLCAREVRLAFRRLIERALPNLAVIAFSEISPNVQVQAHGVVEVESNSTQ